MYESADNCENIRDFNTLKRPKRKSSDSFENIDFNTIKRPKRYNPTQSTFSTSTLLLRLLTE